MANTHYSVLMSVYKNEKPDQLEASIKSMLNQTWKPEQIILIKDGPLTEPLENTIDELLKLDNSNLFTIVTLEQNQGLGVALNKGLEIARNELVARMDTDDIALPTRCEKQVDVFEQNQTLSIVGSNINEFMDDPKKVISKRVVPETHEEILKFSRTRNPFNHPTVMYKKTDVQRVGGYGDFRRNQDYDLFVRMLQSNCRAYNIQESLLLFRANEGNLKRRKSWTKTKSDIKMRYDFWRKGYSSFFDLFMSTSAFMFSFLVPNKVFDIFSKKYLRK